MESRLEQCKHLTLDEFLFIMLKLVEHHSSERLYVTHALIQIYKDIKDAYPDHTITWPLITSVVIETVMEETSSSHVT